MKILLTGATGFIGGALASILAGRGHELRTLSRDPEAARRRLPAGVRAIAWSGTGAPPAEALEGAEAVVHLAGENIGTWPWSADRKRRILESRVLGTRALVEAMGRAGTTRVFAAGSAMGYYGDGGDAILAESAGAGRGFLAEVCAAWESETFKAETLGVRTVAVRTALVLGPGGLLGKMALPYKLGLGPVFGSGAQYWSWIHLRDCAGIFAHALDDASLTGPVNGCSPHPVTQREFADSLAAACHRPRLLRVPGPAMRLGLGDMASSLLEGQRGDCGKILAAGYRFRYPDLPSALRASLSPLQENLA
jgi:uncharacterized protein